MSDIFTQKRIKKLNIIGETPSFPHPGDIFLPICGTKKDPLPSLDLLEEPNKNKHLPYGFHHQPS
jgi:hypothetical protein